MLECVVNVSEGANRDLLRALVEEVADDMLDVHSDPHHNRSVFTLVGEDAPRRLTRRALSLIDVSVHNGVHPRLGAVDVVPFVPLGDSTMVDAIAARHRFSEWVATELGVPVFLYGDERTLPFVRKHAFGDLFPDAGPCATHPTAGAVCVGAREVLVAYNLIVSDVSYDDAKGIASGLRSDSVRALALNVNGEIQVSMNLVKPDIGGPADVYDRVRAHAPIDRAELVGLIPAEILATIPRTRWEELDVSIEQTIEFRMAQRARRLRN